MCFWCLKFWKIGLKKLKKFEKSITCTVIANRIEWKFWPKINFLPKSKCCLKQHQYSTNIISGWNKFPIFNLLMEPFWYRKYHTNDQGLAGGGGKFHCSHGYFRKLIFLKKFRNCGKSLRTICCVTGWLKNM